MANIKREELSGNFLEAFDKIVKLKNSDDAKQREAGLKGEKTLKKLLESKKGQAVKKVVKPKAKATPKKAKATPKKAKATPKKAKATPKKAKATPKKVSVTETNPKGLPFATRVKQRADKDGITFKEARVKLSKEIQDEKDKIEAELKEDKKKALKELEKITKAPEFQQALSQFPKKSSGKKRALKSNVSADGKRQALPRGKRISQGKGANQYGKAKKGKVYYEYRDNRSDVNSVPTKAGQYKYKGKTPPYLEAGGTLPTPFGQAGLVAETGTMNEVDLFAMGGGLPQGVHQYYAQTYNPAYPTPHGYAKGGQLEKNNDILREIKEYVYYEDFLENADAVRDFEDLLEGYNDWNYDELNQQSEMIIAKHFGGVAYDEMLQNVSMIIDKHYDMYAKGGMTDFDSSLAYKGTVVGFKEDGTGRAFKLGDIKIPKNSTSKSIVSLAKSKFKRVWYIEVARKDGKYIYEISDDGKTPTVTSYAKGGNVPVGFHKMPNGEIMADSEHLAKGGMTDVMEIEGKKYRVKTKNKINEDGVNTPIDVYEEVEYAKGGALNSLKKQMNDDLDIHSEYYAKGGEVKTRSGKVLKTDIIHENKSLGLPYQIVYSKFLRENNISKSSLSFADSSELGTIMLTEWEKESSTYAEGGMIEIDEYGSNIPSKLQEVFDQFNEDEDSYKEMERLRLKAQEVGYDFDYDLSGQPTEFMEINKMAKGGALNYFIGDEGMFKGGEFRIKSYQTYPNRYSIIELDENGKEIGKQITINGNDFEKSFSKFAKGGRTISIVNDGVKYDKSKYKAVYGDYDKDGVVNIDDANPLNKNKKGKVEEIELKNTFDKLLGVKAELDEIMYDAVDTLDEKAPKGADIYARTKTPYSILKKLVEKRMLDPKRGLTDMIGTTIAVDNQKELVELRDKIDNGLLGKVLDRDDFYKRPNAGYRAYHYIVEYKGVPVEVQLKTKNMKKLHEVAHKSYKLGTLNPKTLNEVSIVFMKADKGDAKSKVQMEKLLSNKKQLISKISK